MSLLSSISTGDASAFASELAEGLVRDLPPKLMLSASSVISANRVTTILERSYSKAATYQSTKGISFFQRAAFANAFRWRMEELGYPKQFITVATEGLLVHLSKAKKGAKA